MKFNLYYASLVVVSAAMILSVIARNADLMIMNLLLFYVLMLNHRFQRQERGRR